MKAWKKRYKKMVILTIIAIMAFGMVGQALASSDKVKQGLDELTNHWFQAGESSEVPRQILSETIHPAKASDRENAVEQSKARSAENKKQRLRQQDEFNFGKEDVEQLLLSGATLEDIYRADEIGNKWLEDPRELIQQKKQGAQTWEAVEVSIKERKEKQLTKLESKHAKQAAKLSNKKMSQAEKLEILQYVDTHGENEADAALSTFEKEGRKGLKGSKSDKKPEKGGK